MNDIKTPLAIFFDWDGTLVDTYAFLEGAHNHVLDMLNFPAREPGYFKPYFGAPREKIYRALYSDKAADAQALFEAYVGENGNKTKPCEGADLLLAHLHSMNIKMGVVSNKKKAFILSEIRDFGWQDYFLSVIGAGEAPEDKPHGAPLVMALEQAGLRPGEDIWYVGDTIMDLKCALNASCRPLFIGNLQKLEDDEGEYHGVISYKDCVELLESLVN